MSELIEAARRPALAAASLTRTRWAVSLLFLLNGVLFSTWVSRLPSVQQARGLSHGELGLGLLGMALGALLAMPLAGRFSARVGSRRVSVVSALGYLVALPWLAWAPDGPAFFLGLFGFGAAHGALDVAMNAQAVAVEERARRPIMSSFHALFSAGGLAGALLGTGFAAFGTRPWAHFSVVAAGLLAMAALASFPYLLAAEISRPVLPESAATPTPKKKTKLSGRLVLLGAIAFCSMLGEGAMADWSAIYLREITGASESLAAVSYAAFSVAMMTGRIFGDGLTARCGSVRLVRGGGALAGLGLLLALVSAQPLASLIGFAAVGAGLATIVPQVITAAGRVAAADPGPALATTTTIGYFGFLIGPPLIGFVAEVAGLRLALGVMVAACAALVALASYVRTERREERNVATTEPTLTPLAAAHAGAEAHPA